MTTPPSDKIPPPLNAANITSPDLNAERRDTLHHMLPDLFDSDGALDEAAFRAFLAHDAREQGDYFRLHWAGKQAAKKRAFMPTRATLVADPAASVSFETTGNLIIEGDNLEVLKLMQATYRERIKCIYIDPPYNTGKDFLYPDTHADGKKAYWQKNGTVKEGVKLNANPETDGRHHSNWLNMMQARLLLARRLLREDGVIFISIDDHEVHHLRCLCNEIFGEENFVAVLVWKSKSGGGNDSSHFVNEHEYIICYAKNIEELNVAIDKEYVVDKKIYTFEDEHGKYGLVTLDKSSIGYIASLDFEIKDKDGNSYYPRNKNGEKSFRWRWSKEKVENEYEKLVFKDGKVYTKFYQKEGMRPKTLMTDERFGRTASGGLALKEIFKNKIFPYSKPHQLIEYLIRICSGSGDIILDFFAGSGTTAHAVMAQNAKDGGARKFILVQVPEYTDESSAAYQAGYKTISALCRERVRRAGAAMKAEHPYLDKGFRAYKLADSFIPQNLVTLDPALADAENRAALKAYFDTCTNPALQVRFGHVKADDLATEIALKNGYGVFFTLEHLADAFPHNTVYRLTGNDKKALLCLDDAITMNTAEYISEHCKGEKVMVGKHAMGTAEHWVLHRALRDNLQTV